MALDKADLDSIAALIAAGTKDFAKIGDIKPAIDGALEARLKDIPTAESVKAAAEAAAKAHAAPVDPAKGKPKDGEPDPQIAAALKRVEEAEARVKASEASRAETERKAALDATRAKIRAALSANGVKDSDTADALAILEARGSVVLEGDKVGFKGSDKLGFDVIRSIEDGARDFVGTDAGKRWLPPVEARGTGDGRGDRRDNSSNNGTASLASLRGDPSIIAGLTAAQN